MIATGISIYVARHMDQIGPTVIAIGIGVLAAECFVWMELKSRAPLDDYLVLLGALLVAADVGQQGEVFVPQRLFDRCDAK